MADLSHLLARVDAASEPNRALDVAIDATLFGGTPGISGVFRPVRFFRNGELGLHPTPEFSASVDAALALVARRLPGWSRMVDTRPIGRGVRVRLFGPGIIAAPPTYTGPDYAEARAATEPLALLAALLKAEMAREPVPA